MLPVQARPCSVSNRPCSTPVCLPCLPIASASTIRQAQPVQCPPQVDSYAQQHRSVRAHAAGEPGGANFRLDQAARRFAEGIEAGLDPDDLVAQELGKQRSGELSGTLDKYKDKVKAKLTQQMEQTKAEEEYSTELFELGKKAYGKGQYVAAAELLSQALASCTGPYSKLAGDIQLWLGLAYSACGRDKECIALFKTVEKSHPVKRIRKEAYNLRFILEAPKLSRGPDEVVKLPVMGSAARVPQGHNRRAVRQSGGGGGALGKDRRPKTLEEQFWATYKPPELVPNNAYVLTAIAVVATGLAVWSATL